ncbi:unnamed protein product, partial [Laminaria digitata]
VSGIVRRESLHVATSAMIDLVKAYATGGGVWPHSRLNISRPSLVGDKLASLLQTVLLHLKDPRKDGRVMLRALLGNHPGGLMFESVSTSFPARPPLLLLCAPPAAEQAPPPPLSENASEFVGNTMGEISTP